MSKPRRTKRAAPEDLYKSCALGGDCFPDVQNKIEGKTLADRLLQIFGSFLYFGGLGIGTGKGTGGVTGYRPFGAAGSATRNPIRITPETIPRPTVPIDPLGGSEIIPLDVLDASSPSVVPLSEGIPENTIISSGTGPTVNIADLDLTTTIDIPTATNAVEHPAVIDTTEEGTAVLDVQSKPPPAKKFILDTTINENIELLPINPTANEQNVNVFVDTHFGGEVVGENIDYSNFAEVSLDNLPRSSTPAQRGNILKRPRDLYNRFTKQIPTDTLETIVRPSRQVTFEFENPAFDDEVSLTFNQDLAEVTAAPNTDFRDIQYLSKPRYSETESGRITYSRLGKRASMQTRSGLVIGERVHFYYNISDIAPAESIELATFGETSHDTIVINTDAESTFINFNDIAHLSEDNLLDENIEDFSNSHLVLSATDEYGDTYTIPTLPPGAGAKVFIPDVASELNYSFPIDTTSIPSYLPTVPYTPLIPTSVTVVGESYNLHPSLLKRKRKHKYIY